MKELMSELVQRMERVRVLVGEEEEKILKLKELLELMKEKWEQNRLQLEDTLGLLEKME